jgi:delta8-fatty-acid desaturase
MPAVSRKHTKAPSAAPLVGGAKSTSRGAAPTAACYTPAQVAEHDALDDTWVSVDGAVYDLTHWIARHPGGSIPLRQYAGRDMTDAFRAYHGPDGKAAKTLRSYYVGELVMSAEDADAAETSSSEGSAMSADEQPHVFAFRELAKGLETDFHTDYWHYLKLFVSLTTLFASAVYCVIGEGHSTATHMLGAILLGVFWQQTMFIGHDAGHGAITHDHAKDFLIGLVVGNLCNGVGITWWTTTHNVHHCACNSLECDPDIQHMPVLAVTPKYFQSVYSLYHKRTMAFDAAAKALVSVQHYSFYPIMAVARFNLYAQTLILLATSKEIKHTRRVLEFGVMCLYFTWLGCLVSRLPSLGEKVSFALLSHAVGGLIHVQICLSHFSRKVFEGRPESHKWVEMQLSGTMDIDCPKWLDWFHGGLQFQTEHHLVPRMPRHKLRRFREEVVKPFLKEHGLQHDQPSFWEANLEVWRTLKASAKAAKLSPAFVHAINLEG